MIWHALRRAALLRAGAAVVAVACACVLALAVRPAWRERTMLLEELGWLEQDVGERQDLTLALPTAEARLQSVRDELRRGEAGLAAAGDDVAVLRWLEDLAGADVVVTDVLAGALQPVVPPGGEGGGRGATTSAGAAAGTDTVHYWYLPLQVRAAGDQEALLGFLRAVEDELPGMRIRSVLWQETQQSSGPWRLSVSGELYLAAGSI